VKRYFAPGKLVILGEYAVLDGAPAIVAAVDRGVICEVTTGDGLVTPGDDRFVRAALAGAPAAMRRFYDANPADLGGAKAGFGGSAAATVAACLAGGRPAGDAVDVHRQVQGGGSGVDVFASIQGGVRRFPDGAEVACPPMLAVWSGQSASTGPRVRRYLAWAGRASFVAASRALVDRFAAEPFAALREAYARLRAMSAAAGIDYDLPAFARIASLAADFGGAAKPSGAGGGDVAVALLPDARAREAFSAAVTGAGFPAIAVAISPGAHQQS
jgi:phosphomevalonate kinase